MAGSLFCACPEGDSPSAKRQYDAILTGCIPVIVSDDVVYAYSTENQGALDPVKFSVRISEASVVEQKPGLLAQLHAIGKGQILALQQGVKEAAHFYRYYAEVTDGYKRDPLLEGRFPDGGATVSEGERKT